MCLKDGRQTQNLLATSIFAVQIQPKITSLIPNSAVSIIGMTAAGKKMHNHFLFYAMPRSNYAVFHAQFLALCRIHAQRSAYYGARSGLDATSSCQRSWNNFLVGIFQFVLKLFQKVEYYSMLERGWWNIGIPAASTRLFQHRGIFQLCKIKYAKRSEKRRWLARTTLQWSRAGQKAR